MTRAGIVACVAASMLVALLIETPARSEDGLQGLAIDCGGKCAQLDPTGSFLTAIPGGTFVITVAHLAPSPEDARVRTKPRMCDPIQVRVDTLTAQAADGSVAVELGERKQLAAGQSARMVHTVASSSSGDPNFNLDQVAFRVRSDGASPFCRVVASGLYFPEPTSTSPVPFAVLRGAGR